MVELKMSLTSAQNEDYFRVSMYSAELNINDQLGF